VFVHELKTTINVFAIPYQIFSVFLFLFEEAEGKHLHPMFKLLQLLYSPLRNKGSALHVAFLSWWYYLIRKATSLLPGIAMHIEMPGVWLGNSDRFRRNPGGNNFYRYKTN